MLHMIFYKPSFLEHDWLVTVLYSFVGAFGYNKIYLSTMIIVPYLCCLLVGLILNAELLPERLFSSGMQTARRRLLPEKRRENGVNWDGLPGLMCLPC